jgi:lipopolysaccharide transport system permease protein
MNPHAKNSVSIISLLSSVWLNRNLIHQITKREVIGRYRGSAVGLGWSFLNPLLMLLVYTFVFSVVFQTRWNVGTAGEEEGQGVFAVILFAGLIIHAFISDVLMASPNSVVGNVNFVKKVVFPLEVLPVSTTLNAGFHALISLVVWLIAHQLIMGTPSWHIVYLPIVVFPLVVLALGVSYILSSLGVYIRDISQTMSILSTVLLFMSPIFFPLERLPEAFQPLLMMNPLTLIIQQARAVMIFGQVPNFIALGTYLLCALGVLLFGFAWFQKTRKGFADVL